MKILLIRHGKTKGNLEKRYIGRKTDERVLTSEKEAMDELKAKLEIKLKEIRPDRTEMKSESRVDSKVKATEGMQSCMKVYSSPLLRARSTAKAVTGQKKIKVLENLAETDFGDFEGKNYLELSGNPDYQRWINSEGVMPFPNGERREDFIKRSLDALKDIVEEGAAESAKDAEDLRVIVCHGGNIMGIMSSLLKKEYFDFQVGNLDGYFLEIEKEKGEIHVISYCGLWTWLDS